jgi:hypothetical protein
MVDRGHGRPKSSPDIGPAAAPGHGGSLATGQLREGSTRNLSRASPRRGQWCGDRAMAVKRRLWWC